MTKYKKLANDLDNWNERAEMAEDAVKQARNKAKQLVNFWDIEIKSRLLLKIKENLLCSCQNFDLGFVFEMQRPDAQ